MAEIKNENYITVCGWMRNDLKLSGNELLVYALIYGFSQERNCWCVCSQEYISEWIGVTDRAVRNILTSLIKKGVIRKQMSKDEIGSFCMYKAYRNPLILPSEKYSDRGAEITSAGGEEKSSEGCGKNFRDGRKKVPFTAEKSSDNIIDNNIEDIIDNNIIGTKSPARTSKRFIKPTIEEIKAYCIERRNTVNAERFFDYYECNGWKVGKNPMKDWKAAVRTWENNGYSNNSTVNNQTCGINNTKSYAGGWD